MLCSNLLNTCRRINNVSYEQVATYLIPPLRKSIQKRLDDHRSASPSSVPEEYFDRTHFVKLSDLDRKRQKWAEFGSLSNVDPTVLFPSTKEIALEREAEERWWPTLQKMQEDIAEHNEKKMLKKQERDRKIKANMEKMPEWISKFESEQCELAEKARAQEKKRNEHLAQAQEKFGYAIRSNHPLLKNYLDEVREKQKKEKKLLSKQKRKA